MMNKIKVQFIGIENIPTKKDDEILRVRKIKRDTNGYQTEEYLSFHDYHIVFINCPFNYPYPNQTEFFEYISGGGIVVLFLGLSNSYPWGKNLTKFLIVSESYGESINPNPKHWLKTIFGKYRFFWFCLLKPGEILETHQSLKDLTNLVNRQLGKTENNDVFEIAGTTVSGKCVSSVIQYGNGKLILLPIPEKMSEDLIRDLLDGIKKNYITTPETPEPRPLWIEKYNLVPELELKNKMDNVLKEFKTINEKLEGYEFRKKILYASGRELSYSIYLIFKDMGFDPDFKEDKGRQDIEIKYNSFFAIIEAKGLTGFANNKDLRQLLEYHVDVIETNPESKAIFIVNHFRDKNPSERDESPYSKAALELAIKNNFCLITTIDLFKLYYLFLKNELTKTQIIDLLQKTNGLMKLEK